jgi:hypothetical protein
MHRIGATERRSFGCAALALALAWAWLFFDVRYNYGGNWTGLFCIGDKLALPPSLVDRDLYRVPQSQGYDGQFYYYVSHDPFLQGEFLQYVDNSPLRWRRILLPVLAYVTAFGRADFIPAAYIGIVLASVFAGSWWLSRLCQSASCNAVWGLSFLMVPAVATSLDRMTVDSLLAALCVAFASGTARPRDRPGSSSRFLSFLHFPKTIQGGGAGHGNDSSVAGLDAFHTRKTVA